ncbi:PAS domain S-box protein [Muricoccus vinaceus]|uniref:PAS domain S-box protein n=1 Tax=Muricoccus vinaceus TaxID=424704 RepID=A0ABV6IPI4_9PROT
MIDLCFGLALSDEEGRLTQVDRTLCELLGYEPAALVGRTIEALTHPDDWPASRQLLERLRLHDEPFSLAKRYVRGDGSVFWAQAYVSLVRDLRGFSVVSAMIRPVLPATPVLAPGPVLPAVVNEGLERVAAESIARPGSMREAGRKRRGSPAGRRSTGLDLSAFDAGPPPGQLLN